VFEGLETTMANMARHACCSIVVGLQDRQGRFSRLRKSALLESKTGRGARVIGPSSSERPGPWAHRGLETFNRR
jgi:hypothetical protein